MAVFPDRIVLKNSTDDEATIVSSIGNGGADAITPGEIVLGLEAGAASIYTLDSAGSVVNIFGNAIAGTTLDSLSDVNVPSPSDLDVLAWDAPNSEWISRPANPLNDISSNFLGDLGDVVVATATVDQVIQWDGSNWVNHTLTLDYSSDVTLTTPSDGEYLRYNGAAWINTQIEYADIQSVPAFLLDITSESIGDLSDVTITTAATGDTLVWSGTEWVNQAAPPANISANSIGELSDVVLGFPSDGEVLRYNGTNWVDAELDYTDIENRPVNVTDLTNDAGYISDISGESISDLSDVDTSGVSLGDTLAWDGVNWSPVTAPPADISSSSIGELSDVTYTAGDLTVSGVEGILLDAPTLPATDEWSVRSADIGIQLAAFRRSDGSGSYVVASRAAGNLLRSTVQTTILQGTALDGSDRPELRFSNGVNYVSFLTPDSLSQDVTLTLPSDDGANGQILSTDGTGGLYWASASGLVSIGDIPDVDLDTVPPENGYALRYQASTATWISVPPSTGIDLDSVATQGATTDNNVSVGYLLTAQGDGSSNDGRIKLNCSQNSHGVTIQSPPHSDGASYSLILPSTAGAAGQVLTSQGGAQLTWEDASGGATSLDSLSDVDTSTVTPTDGQALVWNAADGEWQPGTVSGGGGVTSIIAGSGISVDQSTGDVTITATGGGGSGGSGAGIYLTETKTSTGGEATFTGLGYSGILQKVTSTVDAWIVLYTSAAERTADASRAFEDDPSTSSGVLAEFYITAGTTVLATPGTTYLNNDTTLTEAIYAAVRTQAGAAVVAGVTISAYGLAAITAVSGGTFGSGV